MTHDIDAASEAKLGREAFQSGKLNLALNHLCQAVRLEPNVQIWLDLAEVYEALGRGNIYIVYLSKAISCLESPPTALVDKLEECKRAFIEANPNVRDVQRLFVKNPHAPRIKQERGEFLRLIDAGKPADAFKLGLKQYDQRRVDPLIQGIWSSLAARNGQTQMGLNAAFAAFMYEPHNWITVTNIADVLCLLRKTHPALDFALAAVNLNAKLPSAWLNLSAAFENLGQHWEAVKACRAAIEINPKDGLAWTNLGNSLKNSGRSSEAAAAYREAVKLQPNHMSLWSNLLFGILYDETATQEEIARETFGFGEYWEPKIKAIDHSARLKLGRPEKLRVGFVSADIRSHPVAYFFEPLLEHIDRDKFEVYIYDNFISEDVVTKRFKGYADKWQNISELKDEEVVKAILKDKIDVLVDMSGHTGRNRLLAFARKPAPVQVTWLGHPATTGLTRMDWRISDHLGDPEGAEGFYTEKLYRFHCASCYAPLVKTPELRSDPKYHVNPTPALLNGFVTFGSCNNLAKLNSKVVRCWSEVLRAVPQSKLLLESPGIEQPEFRKKVLADFAEHGISEDRLLLYNRDGNLQYLRYHDIDIALDPFPYGGGTTSCDLLWMGVPMVTLTSQTVMGRAGTALLTLLDRTDWIAASEQEYVDIAARLASDIGALNRLRFELRPHMEKSPLMNGPEFAKKFGEAFEYMFSEAKSVA